MFEVNGKISDKIRKMFGPKDQAYKPPAGRNDSPSRGQTIPKGVEGHKITGRKPRGTGKASCIAAAVLLTVFGTLVAPKPAEASLWAQCEAFRFCVFTSYYGSHSEYPFCQFTESELQTRGYSMPSACNNNSKSWYNNTRLSITIIDGDGCNAHTPYWRRAMASGQRASGEGSDWINRVSSINRTSGNPDFCGV